MARAIKTRDADILISLSYAEAQLLANLVALVDSHKFYDTATEVRDALEGAGLWPTSTMRAVVAEAHGGPYTSYADFWLEDASDKPGV